MKDENQRVHHGAGASAPPSTKQIGAQSNIKPFNGVGYAYQPTNTHTAAATGGINTSGLRPPFGVAMEASADSE